jgi:hypothetical protein
MSDEAKTEFANKVWKSYRDRRELDQMLSNLSIYACKVLCDVMYEHSFADAYAGAREDLAMWKNRALVAERELNIALEQRNAEFKRSQELESKLSKIVYGRANFRMDIKTHHCPDWDGLEVFPATPESAACTCSFGQVLDNGQKAEEKCQDQ